MGGAGRESAACREVVMSSRPRPPADGIDAGDALVGLSTPRTSVRLNKSLSLQGRDA